MRLSEVIGIKDQSSQSLPQDYWNRYPYQLENKNFQGFINALKNDCTAYLKSNVQPLFRGRKGSFGWFGQAAIVSNRRPMDASTWQTKFFDFLLEYKGIKNASRFSSTFVTGSLKGALEYSDNVVIVFPTDDSTLVSTIGQRDMFSFISFWMNSLVIFYHQYYNKPLSQHMGVHHFISVNQEQEDAYNKLVEDKDFQAAFFDYVENSHGSAHMLDQIQQLPLDSQELKEAINRGDEIMITGTNHYYYACIDNSHDRVDWIDFYRYIRNAVLEE